VPPVPDAGAAPAAFPELRRRLVEDWLGPVLRLPPRERDVLLETLTAWLEADRSAGVAAERLHCHRNTVLNRLQRVAALVGREHHGRQAYVELSLARRRPGRPVDHPGDAVVRSPRGRRRHRRALPADTRRVAGRPVADPGLIRPPDGALG
jgi:hypothetical protein